MHFATLVETSSAESGQQEPPPLASVCTEPGPEAEGLSRWVLAGLGALFLVVAFAQAPGLIEDDTKLPVVMAPLAWMKGALHLWSQTVSSGSVQDQTFGYLFPMAPFFEAAHLFHVPVWCAERVWLGLLLTIGCWGMVRLAEALGIGKPSARVLGGIAYCVAPIVVTWASVSAALLAVVLLPWLLRPLVAGSRGGSPRRAAAKSGVALALMGGVNATVIVAALPLGAIWLLTRASGPRRRALIGWWAVAILLACFWWAFSLVLQGKYGYNYLPYTETAAETTATTSAFATLQGASYWVNYFTIGGPLLPGAWTLVSSAAAIFGTAVVTALGLAGLARRIPERLFLVASLSLGVLVIAIGYAGTLGGPFSHQFQTLLAGSFAPLRNVAKFSPDVALPLALGLTWLVSTVSFEGVTAHRGRRRPQRTRGRRPLIGVVAVAAVLLAAMPFWRQQLYPTGGFTALPGYWQQAANWLDAHQGHQTALLVPGAPFAEYTWGKPLDEPLQVLSHTSVTARSLIPLGSNGNTQLLSTVENALEIGRPPPGLARFLARSGIDYVVERNDLELAATGAPPPALVHQVLSGTPGLTEVASFGSYLPTRQVEHGSLPVYNSTSDLHLRPVEIFEVTPSAPEVRTFRADNPLVVSGSSGSLLPLIASGVTAGRPVVLAGDPHAASVVSSAGATWVITDGNQRRAVLFGRIDHNDSYLLGPAQHLAGAPVGTPLNYGVVTGSRSQTVALPDGARSVAASSFGSTPLYYQPSEGPGSAFDGNPSTAWVGNATHDSVGQWVSITFDRPVPLTSIAVTPLDDTLQRPTISQVTVTTDRGSVRRALPLGNGVVRLAVAPGRTRHLTITIDAVRRPSQPSILGLPLGAGITDVSIPGVTYRPAEKLPTDELAAFASASRSSPIIVINSPVADPTFGLGTLFNFPEPIDRSFSLPKAMVATVAGTAVPLPGLPLERLLTLVGSPSGAALRISASSWLNGLPRFRPENLVEVSPWPWIAGLGDKQPTLTLQWTGKRSVGSVDLRLSPQGAPPTKMVVTSPAGSRTVDVPPGGGVVSFSPMTTDTVTLHFVGVGRRSSVIPIGGIPVRLPLGLASVSLPALSRMVPSPPLPASPVAVPCGTGPTVSIDGTALATSLTGTLENLLDLQPMKFRVCGRPTVSLAPGAHVLSFPNNTLSRVTSLVARSPDPTSTGSAGSARAVRVESWSPAHRTLAVGAGPASIVQVADNFNSGWVATLGGRTLAPIRLDGWEQGWLVPAGTAGTIVMAMVPDRLFRLGLAVGALFLVGLVLLAIVGEDRSRSAVIGQRRQLAGWVIAAGTAVLVLAVGGWLVLLLVPLIAVAHRWGSRSMAALSAAAFVAAGAVVAWHPSAVPGLHRGAFGALAQFASVLALCAVLSALVVDEGRRSMTGRARSKRGEEPSG